MAMCVCRFKPVFGICTECGGTGIAHCCEGERVQPHTWREHISSPDCWCHPVEDHVTPGLWIHKQLI